MIETSTFHSSKERHFTLQDEQLKTNCSYQSFDVIADLLQKEQEREVILVALLMPDAQLSVLQLK